MSLTVPEDLPAGFALTVWAGHARALLSDWLDGQFTWRGVPLSTMIASVDVTFGLGSAVPVWTSHDDQAVTLPVPATFLPALLDGAQPDAYAEDAFDMWHAAWQDLTEHWYLEGRWLHPETRWQIDPMPFASNTACLLIGCVDREDPARPRRYDPTLLPATHDIGVIAFGLSPHRAWNYYRVGCAADNAMLLCAGTAVVEGAVHEALETFQTELGAPAIDPHDHNILIGLRVGWRTTAGIAHIAGTA
jgi:hypothetical protein